MRLWIVLLAAATFFLVGCAGSGASLVGSSWPGITSYEDTAYVAFGPQIYAIDAESGDDIWRFPNEAARDQVFYAPPAVSEDMVVVGDYGGKLHAISRERGNELWPLPFDTESKSARFVAGALIADNYVYAGTAAGVMYALERESGEEVWRFPPDEKTEIGAIWSTPLLVEDTLYFTALDHHLYALNAQTGELRWKFPANGEISQNDECGVGPMVGTPTHHDGVLYFGNFDNCLYALEIESQTVLWKYATDHWVWGSPVFDEPSELVIGGDLQGNVFALNAETGGEAWTFRADGPVVGSPVVGELEDETRVVYVTSGDSHVYTLDIETGDEMSDKSIVSEFSNPLLGIFPQDPRQGPVKIYGSPVLVNNLILVGTHEGMNLLFAFERETFDEMWQFDPSQD